MDIIVEQYPEGWYAKVAGSDWSKTEEAQPSQLAALGMLLAKYNRHFGVISISFQPVLPGVEVGEVRRITDSDTLSATDKTG